MKKPLLLLLCWLCCHVALAQPPAKGRTFYYLMDTASTPKLNRMWSIDKDPPFIMYTLACPCLFENGKPALIRDLRDPGQTISSQTLNKQPLLTLPDLIINASAILNDAAGDKILLVEPVGNIYRIYKVCLKSVEKKYRYSDSEFLKPAP